MKKKELDRHIYLSVGCTTKKDHADFRTENGRLICNHCGKDFTKEAKQIIILLQKMLRKEK